MLNDYGYERFLALWNRISATNRPSIVFADIISRYAEPWRTYHTMAHIEAMFRELDAFRDSPEARLVDFDAVELAIWYHDIVYNPRGTDNEERSGDLFIAVAHGSTFRWTFAEKVGKMIFFTKHSPDSSVSEYLDASVVCDVDLAILGQPEMMFDAYERQIREEYKWVPEAQFREGRAAILRSFLQRGSIYTTNFFRQKYEESARRNLLRSIAQLEAPV